jgi:plasmid maintenance system killer protein
MKSDMKIEVALMDTLRIRHEKNSREYRMDLSNLVTRSMKLLNFTRVSDLSALTGVDLSSLGIMRKAIVSVRVEKVARLINKLSERLDIVIDENSITVKPKAV